MKDEKIRYKTRPIRMDDRTWEKLKEGKIKFGKSWNLYILEIVKLSEKISKINGI